MTLEAVIDSATLAPEEKRVAVVPRRPGIRRSLEAGARIAVPLLAGAVAAWSMDAHLSVALTVVAMWLLVQLRASAVRLRSSTTDPARLLRLVAIPFTVVAAGVMVGAFGQAALLTAMLISAAATLALAVTSALLRTRPRARRVMLVGDADGIGRVATAWTKRPDVDVVARQRVADGTEDLAELVGLLDVETVVLIPSPDLGWERVREIGWRLEDTRASLALCTELDGVADHRLAIAALGGSTVAEIAPSRPPLHVRYAKSAIDRACGLLLLIAFTPLLVALAIAIRMDSPGAALFTQTRVGVKGRLFKVYKLRTMCTDAEDRKQELGSDDEGNGVLFKIKRDPRITRIGQVLRRTSLDELPQLINVVRGEMSLVGPRPALPDEVAAYDEVARRRLAVKPGMTGLWQVSGRSDLDWDGTVALDVRYTDNVAIGEDLRICWRTIGAVTSGRGAY